MRQIKLFWKGPYEFHQLINDDSIRKEYQVRGVYIWILHHKSDEKKELYYVGRASGKPNLWQRQWQHYKNYIGGIYDIPGEFRKSGEYWSNDVNDKARNVILDKRKFLELVSEAFDFTKYLKIFLCPLKEEDPQHIKIVERNLLYDLQPTGTTGGKESEPSNRLKISHRNATWATEEIRRKLKERVVFL